MNLIFPHLQLVFLAVQAGLTNLVRNPEDRFSHDNGAWSSLSERKYSKGQHMNDLNFSLILNLGAPFQKR